MIIAILHLSLVGVLFIYRYSYFIPYHFQIILIPSTVIILMVMSLLILGLQKETPDYVIPHLVVQVIFSSVSCDFARISKISAPLDGLRTFWKSFGLHFSAYLVFLTLHNKSVLRIFWHTRCSEFVPVKRFEFVPNFFQLYYSLFTGAKGGTVKYMPRGTVPRAHISQCRPRRR